MRTTWLTLLSAAAASTAAGVSAAPVLGERTLGGIFDDAGAICGCWLLNLKFSDRVIQSSDAAYTAESKSYFWSETTHNSPRCVFLPASAQEVATGIQTVKLCQAKFAVRGGGHMPNAGFTNIDKGGILFSTSNLDALALSADKKTVTIGPAHRWGDVYEFLAPHGLVVMGGRLAPVGVPGLILSGGLNFFSNRYGLAADNIVAFEIALATGDVVEASATSHADLFWALKGAGAGTFGVVTKFKMKTVAAPAIWASMTQFIGEPNFDSFYSALANFTHADYAAKGAGIIPQVNILPGGAPPVGVAVLAHEGTDMDPAIFREFRKITPAPGTERLETPATMSMLASILGDDTGIPGKRHAFRVQSSLASLKAGKIMHTILLAEAAKLPTAVPSLASAGIALQPISPSLVEAGYAAGGNAMALTRNEPRYWYAMSINWMAAADDLKANAWLKGVGDKMVAEFKRQGVLGSGEFLYINDAQGDQDPFAHYGSASLTRLRQVRQRYDPLGWVFGENGLCRGGFKF